MPQTTLLQIMNCSSLCSHAEVLARRGLKMFAVEMLISFVGFFLMKLKVGKRKQAYSFAKKKINMH